MAVKKEGMGSSLCGRGREFESKMKKRKWGRVKSSYW